MKGFVKLLTICAILPICLAGQGDPERHSLYYVYTALSKAVNAPGIFEFTAMGLLDDRKIDYYDSKHQVKIPQQNWMKEKLPADYWEKGTQSRKSKEQWFKVNVNILMERMRQNQSDVHVLMWKHGCKADKMADGSFTFVSGVDAYSYDGNDFLSFDDASMQWVAPVTEAVPTKQKWDGVPILNQYTKGYLEKECVDWLKSFSEYGSEELQRQTKAVPPKVTLFAKSGKSSDMLKLTCMATGFYPKEMYIAILKGEKVIKEGTPEDVMPNGDGTHQIKLNVDVKSSDVNNYECVVKHIAMEAPITKVWNLDGKCPDCNSSFKNGTVVGVVVVLLIVTPLVILVLIACKRGIIVFNNGRLQFNGFRRQPQPQLQPSPPVNEPLLVNATTPAVIQMEPNPAEPSEADSGQGSPPGSSNSSAEDVNQNGSQPQPPVNEPLLAVTQMEPKPAETTEADSGQGSSSSDGSPNSSAEDVNQNGGAQ